MIKVIINADDLGLNPVVNGRIEAAFQRGTISSATILANTGYSDEVLRIYKEYKDKVSFGIHLNLTQGKSLTQSHVLQKYGIIDENGDFTKIIHRLGVFDLELRNAIKDEWLAQIKQIQDMGISISHIDGHHHVHGIVPLEDVLIEVAIGNDIKKVRSRYRAPFMWSLQKAIGRKRRENKSPIIEKPNASNVPHSGVSSRRRSIIGYSKSIIQEIGWRKAIGKAGINTTDYFGQYSTIFNTINAGLKLPDDSIIELMCHPGHPQYEQEEKAVEVNLLSEILNFALISYNEI